MRQRRHRPSPPLPVLLVARMALASALCLCAAPALGQGLPDHLSDSTFWRMVDEFSEAGGFFRSDNFVSNEAAFQYVIPQMKATIAPGSVYLGVGPDQNFTYIVAFEPRIAFIVDIRRGAMLQHLMYKALLEMSADRADFVSRLVSRPRPANVDTASTPESLFAAFAAVPTDSGLRRLTLAAIHQRLVETHGFRLSSEDLAGLDYVFDAFFVGGPDITYNFGQGIRGFGGSGMPSYAQLQTESDGQGVHRAYLATEANYRLLRDLEVRNLIVPVVGDFAGPKALRAVGNYVRERGANVSVFYTSNVEQYLFQQADDWNRFYTNVATLPIDSTSSFIRSVSQRGWVASQNPNSRSAQLVASIGDLLTAFRAGQITGYYDVILRSRQ